MAPAAEYRRPGPAVDPLEQGNIEQSRQQLKNAENELRRLARDLDAIPDDPRELARRLTRRQEELREEVKQAVRRRSRTATSRRPRRARHSTSGSGP